MTGVGGAPRDLAAFVRSTKTRLVALERRQGISSLENRLVGAGGIALSGAGSTEDPIVVAGPQGTTAERNARYGVPTTSAERVALANRRVKWWNQDLGWDESYYTVSGQPGLTARPLVPGTASGWYPTGLGPYLALNADTAFPATVNNYLGNWSSALDRRLGGTDWFTYAPSGLMQIKVAGVYDLSFWTTQQAGSGASNFIFRVLDATGTPVRAQDGLAVSLQGSLSTLQHGELFSLQVNAGWQLGVFVHTGSLQVHSVAVTPRAQMVARYQGPALAFD